MVKAATLRRQRRSRGVHAKQDEVVVHFRDPVMVNFSWLFRMFFTGP
jgi:hypothetical protein